MANEVQTQVFDYTELDVTTADEMRAIEFELEETLNQFALRVGGIIKKAQETLAKRGYGCFTDWLAYVGIPKSSAYEYIDIHNLFVRTADNRREILEGLPKKLLVQVAAKSAESTEAKAQAKAEVLDGSIETLKQYRERIAELEAQALAAKMAQEIAMRQLVLAEQQLATATKPETVVVEKEVERVVEVAKTDIQRKYDDLYEEFHQLKYTIERKNERIGHLERMEKVVRAQEESPMYDLTRSLQTTNRYFDTFTTNRGFMETAVACSDGSTVQALKTQLLRNLTKTQEVLSVIDDNDGIITIDVIEQ